MSCCETTNDRALASNGQAVQERTVERRGVYEPAVDIYETPSEWVLTADVPGATREDIELNVEENVLHLRAQVRSRHGAGMDFDIHECPVGDFERRFRLGEGVNTDAIDATLDAGVLTIRLPKTESMKPRKIEIR